MPLIPSNVYTGGGWADMADMIKRDRNHPSIICKALVLMHESVSLITAVFMSSLRSLNLTARCCSGWSLCNEYGCVLSEYNVTLTIGKKFRSIIKDLDKSRPISGAWNGDMKLGLMWAEQVTDMFGLNYNYGQYDPFHKQFPKTPFISSESCSW